MNLMKVSTKRATPDGLCHFHRTSSIACPVTDEVLRSISFNELTVISSESPTDFRLGNLDAHALNHILNRSGFFPAKGEPAILVAPIYGRGSGHICLIRKRKNSHFCLLPAALQETIKHI